MKSLTFTRDSEVTLGLFWGFLCYVWGTKLGGALPLRMRHSTELGGVLPLRVRHKAMQRQ